MALAAGAASFAADRQPSQTAPQWQVARRWRVIIPAAASACQRGSTAILAERKEFRFHLRHSAKRGFLFLANPVPRKRIVGRDLGFSSFWWSRPTKFLRES
jgi:hypothetical protein